MKNTPIDAYGRPVRDKELLRRIDKAKATQRVSNAELHDPIENDPRFSRAILEAKREADRDSSISGMGRCHDVWGRTAEILKKQGIVWYSPARMNLDILFD
jgi:hypothetical protein